MAEFQIDEVEGMRFVQISIRDETVRAEAGALSYLQGDIRITARLPSIGSAIKAMISDESAVRPSYSGTGTIHLEPSMGGYCTFEVADERGSSRTAPTGPPTAAWSWGCFASGSGPPCGAGEGPIDYQTKVSGRGRVVLNAPGPVEQVVLHGERLVVEGKLVIARTAGLEYRVRRATKFFQSSSEAKARCGPTRAKAKLWYAGRPIGTST